MFQQTADGLIGFLFRTIQIVSSKMNPVAVCIGMRQPAGNVHFPIQPGDGFGNGPRSSSIVATAKAGKSVRKFALKVSGKTTVTWPNAPGGGGRMLAGGKQLVHASVNTSVA
jgi:hypothetical protein